MFCSKCGAQNPDGVKFCSKCGALLSDNTVPVSNHAPRSTVYESEAKPKNVKGIIGFILGIISILLSLTMWGGLLAGIPGLILSISANKKKDHYQPSGLPKAGIVLSIIGLVIVVLYAGIVLPQIARYTSMAR
ncbi:MAG: zinc-ribbon domain-containing protein [Clostridiales bacterium]|nr:zinc-ribbon domain-containing protein [Clostridiales bacterium]